MIVSMHPLKVTTPSLMWKTHDCAEQTIPWHKHPYWCLEFIHQTQGIRAEIFLIFPISLWDPWDSSFNTELLKKSFAVYLHLLGARKQQWTGIQLNSVKCSNTTPPEFSLRRIKLITVKWADLSNFSQKATSWLCDLRFGHINWTSYTLNWCPWGITNLLIYSRKIQWY